MPDKNLNLIDLRAHKPAPLQKGTWCYLRCHDRGYLMVPAKTLSLLRYKPASDETLFDGDTYYLDEGDTKHFLDRLSLPARCIPYMTGRAVTRYGLEPESN